MDAMNGLGRKGAISESLLADRPEGSVEPRSEPFARVSRLDVPGNTKLMGDLREVVLGDTVAFGNVGDRREAVVLDRKVHQQA
jgi:hypothetical protein